MPTMLERLRAALRDWFAGCDASEWHHHRAWSPVRLDDGTTAGFGDYMRRWTGAGWAYRRMTADELNDAASREAW